MTQKKSMNSFYLSEYFVISFLCTIFANIKRTIKKHHRFSTIIIDTIPIHPLHSPIISTVQHLPFNTPTGHFPFIIMYPRIHTHRRVFPYFFFRPCYTHSIINRGQPPYPIYLPVCNNTQRKYSLFQTKTEDITIISVNFAFAF